MHLVKNTITYLPLKGNFTPYKYITKNVLRKSRHEKFLADRALNVQIFAKISFTHLRRIPCNKIIKYAFIYKLYAFIKIFIRT